MRLALLALLFLASPALAEPVVIRSAQSGNWSDPKTWDGGKLPAADQKVLIRPAHRVVYDVSSEVAIRSLHIGGQLSFAPNKDTLLRVALIKIQPGESTDEDGFDCDGHDMNETKAQSALEVGTPTQPIDAKFTARISLVMFDDMKADSLPAIICCGGRMDFHGAVMNRTWVKLGATAKKGDKTISLNEAVTGWRIGDRILLTATKNPDETTNYTTEECIIRELGDKSITVETPIQFDHTADGEYRGEVANLSRNVIVESADPTKARGHTMYHRHSAGAISYAEFRHLGKLNTLGRYALHFHLIGDTMRGSYVIGASIWDSANRWLTVHGTNYLVVRDCVGYKSVGHGYFLEDGTEVYNTFDRNLAIQAARGKALPKQVLPFDQNEGAGFWWANSLNTFTRNVTVENHRYGYRYEATPSSRLKSLEFAIQQPDGTKQKIDIRTLPFVRFEDNESHCDELYGLNIGEGVNRVGPDERHPFVVRNYKAWELHYAFRPQAPCMIAENVTLHRVVYGVYHPNFDRHVYRNLTISQVSAEPFNRGHDDLSIQYGSITVDGLTFLNHRSGGMPLIQMSDDNPSGEAVSHFRNVKVITSPDGTKRALANRGGGPRPKPKSATSVPVILHDYYGSGQHAKIVSTASPDYKADEYKHEVGVTGDESRVAHVGKIEFPKLLDPVDDRPPTTVITAIRQLGETLTITGTTSDNGEVKRVLVNGQVAKATRDNFAEWTITIPMNKVIAAHAEDAAGNIEPRPHTIGGKH